MRGFFNNVQIKEPYEYKNLAIFPVVFKGTPGKLEYVTLDDALSSGELVVKEVAEGEVNVVEAKNEGEKFVFGMTGEVILGAKQDRMLKADVLFPPHSDWLRIPVYCTERGRWHLVSKDFRGSHLSVPVRVRQEAAESESQSGVWGKISEYSASFQAYSPTEALGDILETEEVKEEIAPYVSEFEGLPSREPEAIGVVIAVGDEILVTDLFGDHELFSKLWKKLLRSYVVDALGEERKRTITVKDAEAFAQSAASAEYSSEVTPGVGEVLTIVAKKAKGSVLLHTGSLVHLDLFPFSPEKRTEEERAPRLDDRRDERLRRE